MLPIQSKKMMLPLAVCLMSLALSPVITHAEGMETGSTAARQAADQKAALARKAADRQKATEEKQTLPHSALYGVGYGPDAFPIDIQVGPA